MLPLNSQRAGLFAPQEQVVEFIKDLSKRTSFGETASREELELQNAKRDCLIRVFQNQDRFLPFLPLCTGKHTLVNQRANNKKICSFERTAKTAYLLTDYLLGEGEMKKAKVAIDLKTNQFVARITGPHKRRRRAFNDHFSDLRKIKNEIKIMQSFSGNEDFVQLISYHFFVSSKGIKKATLFLELCDKETLEDLIGRGPENRTKEGEKELVQAFLSVLNGLIAMKEKNIIHRDLKPANIFLSKASNGNRKGKIGDFGYALKGKLTCRIPYGTPLYMSPDQIIQRDKERGTSPLDSKDDLWSLGSMLYEAMTGKPMYEELYKSKFQVDDPITTLPELISLCKKLEQKDFSKLLEKPCKTLFEQKIQKIAKRILIIDSSQRPDVEKIQDLFVKEFLSPPPRSCCTIV